MMMMMIIIIINFVHHRVLQSLLNTRNKNRIVSCNFCNTCIYAMFCIVCRMVHVVEFCGHLSAL
jgi:hypothetical protein